MKHNNVHSYDEFQEVYKTLQKEMVRDYKWQRAYEAIAVISFVIFISAKDEGLIIFFGITTFIAFLSSVKNFIDNSNRNWHLHMIDYLREKQYETKSRY
jgi:hypothetical protein